MSKKTIPKPPKTLEDCKTDAERIDWLRLRVDQLERENKAYREDGLYALYFSHNRKMVELSESLNSFELSLTSNDKTFERYNDLVKLQPAQIKLLDSLRKDYLKMDEEKLREVEKSGVPLIERKVGKR